MYATNMDDTDWTPSASGTNGHRGPSMIGSMIGNSLPMLLGTYLSQTLPIEDPTARTLIAFQSGQMLGNIARVAADKICVPEFVHRWWNPLPKCRMPYRVRVASDSPMFDKLEQHVLGLHVEKLRRCDLRARSGMIELTLTHATFTQPIVERWTDAKTNQCHEIGLRILSSSHVKNPKKDGPDESELMKCDRLEFDAMSRESESSSASASSQSNKSGGMTTTSVPRLMGGCDGDILVSSVTANCSVLREYVMHVYQLRETSELRAMTIFVTRSSGTTLDQKNKKKKDGPRNKRARKTDNDDDNDGEKDGEKDGKNARTIEWEKIKVVTNRCLDNTMTSDTVDQELVRDVKRFMESEEWYNRRGLTYKRGYLLHGPPGTGKTSLVKAIAMNYKCKVFVLDLNQVETNEELMRLTTEISYHLAQNERYILLLEDVDRCRLFAKYRTDPEKKNDNDDDECGFGRYGQKRKKKDDDDGMEPTMDCLLNVFDGIIETQGRLLFLTGNDTSPLHAVPNGALLRPGRIDRQVHVPHCTDLQMRKILRLFYELPTAIEESVASDQDPDPLADLPPLKENAQLSAAMLTLVCQNYADDLPQAIAHVKSLYCNDPNAPIATDPKPDAEALELEKRLKHTGEEKFGFGRSRMMSRRARRRQSNTGSKWERATKRAERDLKDMEKLKSQIVKVQDRLSKSVQVPSLEALEKEELLVRLRKIESEVSASKAKKPTVIKKEPAPKKKRTARKSAVKQEQEGEPVQTEHKEEEDSSAHGPPRTNARYSLRPGKKNVLVVPGDETDPAFEMEFIERDERPDDNDEMAQVPIAAE